MVLGDAHVHAMVDGGNCVDERSRSMPHGNAISAIL